MPKIRYFLVIGLVFISTATNSARAGIVPPMELNAMLQSFTVDLELATLAAAIDYDGAPVTFHYSSNTTDTGFSGTLSGSIVGKDVLVTYNGSLTGVDPDPTTNYTWEINSQGTFGSEIWQSAYDGTITIVGDPRVTVGGGGKIGIGTTIPITPGGVVSVNIDAEKDFYLKHLGIQAGVGVVTIGGRSLLGVQGRFDLNQDTGNYSSAARAQYLFINGKWHAVDEGTIDLHPTDPTDDNLQEDITVGPIPEPSSVILMGLGTAAVLMLARKSRRIAHPTRSTRTAA